MIQERPTSSTAAHATYFHVCSSCSLCFQADLWRVISAQTDGGKRCGAPEGKDARSDQAEFCSRGGNDVQLHWGFCFAHWCQAGTVLLPQT